MWKISGDESLIDPSSIEWHVRFTHVPFKPLYKLKLQSYFYVKIDCLH